MKQSRAHEHNILGWFDLTRDATPSSKGQGSKFLQKVQVKLLLNFRYCYV
jgi:hypothetical protein